MTLMKERRCLCISLAFNLLDSNLHLSASGSPSKNEHPGISLNVSDHWPEPAPMSMAILLLDDVECVRLYTLERRELDHLYMEFPIIDSGVTVLKDKSIESTSALSFRLSLWFLMSTSYNSILFSGS